MGGAVKGGLIHGQYLDDMTAAGARVLSRGRVIPTLPWEAMWYPIAQVRDCRRLCLCSLTVEITIIYSII